MSSARLFPGACSKERNAHSSRMELKAGLREARRIAHAGARSHPLYSQNLNARSNTRSLSVQPTHDYLELYARSAPVASTSRSERESIICPSTAESLAQSVPTEARKAEVTTPWVKDTIGDSRNLRACNTRLVACDAVKHFHRYTRRVLGADMNVQIYDIEHDPQPVVAFQHRAVSEPDVPGQGLSSILTCPQQDDGHHSVPVLPLGGRVPNSLEEYRSAGRYRLSYRSAFHED